MEDECLDALKDPEEDEQHADVLNPGELHRLPETRPIRNTHTVKEKSHTQHPDLAYLSGYKSFSTHSFVWFTNGAMRENHNFLFCVIYLIVI